MKVTVQQIEKSWKALSIKYELAKQRYEKQTAKYKAQFIQSAEKSQQRFDTLCESYFDKHLVDANGSTVKVGDLITSDDVVFFKVKKRVFSMNHRGQFSFPFVICSRLNANKSKDIRMDPTELQMFVIKPKKEA